ncbi:homodimeric glycerol 3-phosphate dehydrogenase (quinone) [Hoeflea halophila]|uniref:Glycerol-3-phosphate dehydrogenase n=1 Tax=Hoeflea halophila TaxID=714899 RepID=A0A286HMS4_9HYPH|nr:glycerol-3-phosphate dehydrogenase [Hoeflea halophila]SOE09081.1 homodimeric glycerol 3-phosphate dehydrogenase (quinone) [Hoeflea halophila]
MAQDKVYDVFVIGGGINGCGIARDAIGRGYSVFLAEMNDLASGTSSWSSKLIHGGFRYLEYYEFRLVREALSEREVLLSNAPHIIWPMRFVLPHHKDMRPAWLLRLGLFLYDHIGKRKLLPGTTTVDLKTSPVGKPLKPLFSKGFEYSDCWVNDARLVVLNARDAADRGAEIRTRTEVVSAERKDGIWEVSIKDRMTRASETVKARLIVNAGGPWVDRILTGVVGRNDARNVRLVQGSHIVVPKLHDHDRAYIFQNGDGRIIFALPYEEDFTLIGTTDQDYTGDPKDVVITDGEIDYLCAAASEYFAKPVERDSIVWTYSGVRPLYDDGASEAQEATRDYVLKPDPADGAPLINIFGGKITTARKLAESMLELIEDRLGKKSAPWTHRAALPGGDFPPDGYDSQVARLQSDYPFLDPQLTRRYVRQYGTCAWKLLGNAASLEDLGQNFGYGLHALEVDYLISHEWAREAADVIWRRTKRGLRLDAAQVSALETYMADARAA